MAQRGQRRRRGVYPALKLCMTAVRLEWRQIGPFGEARIEGGDSAGMHRVDLVGAIVGARAEAAIRGNRRDNQAGMTSAKDLAVQSAAWARGRRNIVDEN